MTDHAIFRELINAFGEILPHQVLCKGERRHSGILKHLKAGNIAHGLPHLGQHLRHVHAAVIAGQLRFQRAEIAVEVLFEKLHERRIKPHVILMMSKPIGRPYAAAEECDRHQDQRSPIGLGVCWVLLPMEKPNRQKKRVGPSLGEVILRPAVDGGAANVEIAGLKLACHFISLQSLPRKLQIHVFLRSLPVQVRVALANDAVLLERHQPHPLAESQAILQQRYVGAEHRDGLLGQTKVQQSVSHRQIEQFSLPAFDPSGRGLWCGFVRLEKRLCIVGRCRERR